MVSVSLPWCHWLQDSLLASGQQIFQLLQVLAQDVGDKQPRARSQQVAETDLSFELGARATVAQQQPAGSFADPMLSQDHAPAGTVVKALRNWLISSTRVRSMTSRPYQTTTWNWSNTRGPRASRRYGDDHFDHHPSLRSIANGSLESIMA